LFEVLKSNKSSLLKQQFQSTISGVCGIPKIPGNRIVGTGFKDPDKTMRDPEISGFPEFYRDIPGFSGISREITGIPRYPDIPEESREDRYSSGFPKFVGYPVYFGIPV